MSAAAAGLLLAICAVPQTDASAAPRDETHWAFRRPERPALPAGTARHPIDRFVDAALAREGLAPAPRAGPEELLRRVTLALTGLQPTLAELDAFVADPSDAAYERAVDRLLGSVAYAEHQTRRWLDLARYADSNGYEKDRSRRIWPWRDWVIDAYDRDLPFDRFTIEQLAGDLLPEPTLDQRIATGFHRNSMLNDEGGVDAEEFRVVAVKDRVDATARIWLGLTLDCAQCHDHKYDPITLDEYYRFYAFFDQTSDDGVGEAPTLDVPLRARRDEHARLCAELAALERDLLRRDAAFEDAFGRWLERARRDAAERRAQAPIATPWRHCGPLPSDDPRSAYAREFPPEREVRTDRALYGIAWQERPDWDDGRVHAFGDTTGVHFLHRTLEVPAEQLVTFHLGSDDGIEVRIDGVERLSRAVERPAAPDQDQLRVVLAAGVHDVLLKIVNTGGPSGFCFRLGTGDEPDDVTALLLDDAAHHSPEQRARLEQHYTSVASELAPLRAAIDDCRRRLAGVPVETTMVLAARGEPRRTRVLERGDFRRPLHEVTPGVPRALHPYPPDAPADRLGLARWLVSPDNPLLGRVAVNRIWAELFGRGLVVTPEDFGTRGEPPSHPELLDWLALEFVDGGYSLKRLQRLIVTSAAFRRSARQSVEVRARDPYNVWLARGPRTRLGFEAIRDVALRAAGLLSERVGGPSVMPPQPPGVWENSFGFYDLTDRWIESLGTERYRRGIYVHLRRTAPYPTFQLFDGPRREVCTVERSRTNTPLQALATLNDPAFVEAAGGLALRALDHDGDDDARLEHAMRLCTSRRPAAGERGRLAALLREATRRYADDADAAHALCAAARTTLGDRDPRLVAPWIVVANTLLNLDETLSR